MAKGDSPYSTGFASGQINFDLDPTQQMRKYKAEELETYQAPFVLPYEISNLPEYYANMVDNGLQAAKTIENYLKSENIPDKEELLKLMKNTEKMVMYLFENVDKILDNYVVGAKVGSKDDDEDDEPKKSKKKRKKSTK